MRGAIPLLHSTSSWRGTKLSTGTTLHLPLHVSDNRPSSYPVSTGDCSLGYKLAGAWNWPYTSK